MFLFFFYILGWVFSEFSCSQILRNFLFNSGRDLKTGVDLKLEYLEAKVYCKPGLEIYYETEIGRYYNMKTRKQRAARVHSQSDAPLAPTGNQAEAQGKVSSPHSASDPNQPSLY